MAVFLFQEHGLAQVNAAGRPYAAPPRPAGVCLRCPARSRRIGEVFRSVPTLSRNAWVRSSLCPYRPLIFCTTYSSTFRRASGGIFCDERMRLITMAVGPALLSELRNAQAVLRDSPRTVPCLAGELYPAAINASRISASFEASLAFSRLVCRIVHPPHNCSLMLSAQR